MKYFLLAWNVTDYCVKRISVNAAVLAVPKSWLKLVSADSYRFRNPRGRRPLQEARVGEADEGVERVAEDRGESEAALFVERGADGVSETFRDQYCKTFLCRSWWYCVKVGFALSSTASLLRFMQSQVIFWQKCKKLSPDKHQICLQKSESLDWRDI